MSDKAIDWYFPPMMEIQYRLPSRHYFCKARPLCHCNGTLSYSKVLSEHLDILVTHRKGKGG